MAVNPSCLGTALRCCPRASSWRCGARRPNGQHARLSMRSRAGEGSTPPPCISLTFLARWPLHRELLPCATGASTCSLAGFVRIGPHAWTVGGIDPPAAPAGSACHQTLAWCSLPSGPRMPGRACVAVGHPQMRVTLAPAVQTHGSFGACVDVRPLHACRAARHSWNTGSICIHMRRQPTHFALLVSRL